MLIAIAAITGLSWWDNRRESEAALDDLGREQAFVASSLASSLNLRLGAIARDAELVAQGHLPCTGALDAVTWSVRSADVTPLRPTPPRFAIAADVGDGRVVDLELDVADLLAIGPGHDGDSTVLVAPPATAAIYADSGALAAPASLRSALATGAASARLSRPEAAQLGLAPRTAMAGIARVDAGSLGRWTVVAVSSAARQRDRDVRAWWRLVLGVALASSLVLAFGGVALRNLRKELELERELAVADVAHARDDELARAGRVATMGTFATGVVHEVSTPLGVIVGRAEQIAGRSDVDERTGRSARVILEQADRIQLIVRRFMNLARGGAPSLDRADPAQIVASTVTAVQHRFERAGVALASLVPADLPGVRCDRALLEHALANLLLNACDASTPDGHVAIAARSDGSRVTFVVTDDGVGISPEHAARITEPFFTTKPAERGTGLGLAIAAEIAKSHRGELTVVAAEARGTRASITIPIAAGEAVERSP